MAIARFKDLCLDVSDAARLGPFWSAVLGRTWEVKDGSGLVTGPTPQHTIWINPVPEAKSAKNRVHLDIYARDLVSGHRRAAAAGSQRHALQQVPSADTQNQHPKEYRLDPTASPSSRQAAGTRGSGGFSP